MHKNRYRQERNRSFGEETAGFRFLRTMSSHKTESSREKNVVPVAHGTTKNGLQQANNTHKT